MLFQARLAARAVFGLDTRPAYFSLTALQLAGQGVHSRLNKLDRLEMVFPPQAMTTPTHDYLLKGFALVLALAIMIGVPFAIILEWLVIFPLRRMVTDLIAFTRDPYRQGQGEIIPTHHNILNEARQALDTMTTATRNELVQRDKLAALGEASTTICAMFWQQRCCSRTVWKTAKSRQCRTGCLAGDPAHLCSHMLLYLKQPDAPTTQPISHAVSGFTRQ